MPGTAMLTCADPGWWAVTAGARGDMAKPLDLPLCLSLCCAWQLAWVLHELFHALAFDASLFPHFVTAGMRALGFPEPRGVRCKNTPSSVASLDKLSCTGAAFSGANRGVRAAQYGDACTSSMYLYLGGAYRRQVLSVKGGT